MERCSCEADLGLGLNAGLSPCESCGSLICTVQYMWIVLKPWSHQAVGGGSQLLYGAHSKVNWQCLKSTLHKRK